MRMRTHRILLGVGALVLGVGGVVACDTSKFTEPFKDAPRSGREDGGPMDVIRMSDGFSNLGFKCVDGNGVYVLYHGDKAYGGLFVVAADPRCKDGGR